MKNGVEVINLGSTTNREIDSWGGGSGEGRGRARTLSCRPSELLEKEGAEKVQENNGSVILRGQKKG